MSPEQLTDAVSRFGEAMEETPDKNKLAVDGAIQRFEFCYDLSWETLRRFLQAEGISVPPTPREVLKQAFKLGWLGSGGGPDLDPCCALPSARPFRIA